MLSVEKSIDAVRVRVREARRSGKVVGLVPTMGALHAGHARLIEESAADSGFVVVSIFVNPMQFGPGEDLDRYPRTFEDDLRLCESLGAEPRVLPSRSKRCSRKDGSRPRSLEVPRLSHIFEGAIRPIHFRGVATIVLKLFASVEPDHAYFGAKDYQQQLIIRRMVWDLNLPVEIRTIDTVREPDGLALSSRNRYLDPAQRAAASVLPSRPDRGQEGRRRRGDRPEPGSTDFDRDDRIRSVGSARVCRGGGRSQPRAHDPFVERPEGGGPARGSLRDDPAHR